LSDIIGKLNHLLIQPYIEIMSGPELGIKRTLAVQTPVPPQEKKKPGVWFTRFLILAIWEDCGSRPAWANNRQNPISKNNQMERRCGSNGRASA
jgi:hypothetical protein